MVSWASNLAADDRAWTLYVQIEGLGHGLNDADFTASGSDARTRFSTFNPAFALGQPSALWRPYLTEAPEILSERADPSGGTLESGSLTFSVLDFDNYLTGQMRVDRSPSTSLTVATSASAGAITVGSTTSFVQFEPIYIGGEAMRVDLITSGTTANVKRGYLGTTAAKHDNGDRVFLSSPQLEGRRATFSIAPLDSTSSADARELGTYVIDGGRWDRACNIYTFRCRSQLNATARLIPYQPRQAIVRIGQSTQLERVGSNDSQQATLVDWRQWTGTESEVGGALFFIKVGSEVVAVESGSPGVISSARWGRRPVLGGQQEDISDGATARQVFCAEPISNSFRYSPGPSPSTSRASGTWVKSAQWCDLLLCIMTSSHDAYDGLELTNYRTSGTDAERSNWSCLPSGFGLGLRTAEIDVPGFLDLKQRTLDVTLPKFCFGDKVEPFGVLLEREFLRPLGAFLSVVDGVAKIILPRTPLAEAASLTLGSADLLVEQVGGENHPRLDLSREQNAVSQLSYELGPSAYPVVVTSGNYRDTYGQSNVFSESGNALKIEVPGADENDAGLWSRQGVKRLYRSHRPRNVAIGDFDFGSVWGWAVGQLAAFTLPELPNFRDTTRGWVGVQLQLLERTARADATKDGLATGLHFNIRATAYGPETRVGRVAPAANVVSSAGSVATVSANRYTASDARDGLPTSDAASFTNGDVVKLLDVNGVEDGASGTQIVQSTGVNTITLNGDFNGNLGPTGIIAYADSASASTTQLARYAYWADRSAQTIGAGTAAPWIYGEP